jgi:hypothetical protein
MLPKDGDLYTSYVYVNAITIWPTLRKGNLAEPTAKAGTQRRTFLSLVKSLFTTLREM